jgi:hypothetical protein
VRQDAVAGFELWQRLVEINGFFVDNLPHVEVNDNGA